MKVLIMGSGGVGGYYGGRLALAGNEVTFIARGPHGAAMRAHGLRLQTETQPALIQPVRVLEDPREAGTVDLVLIAVKLWETSAAARAIVPTVGESTAVLSLQNGIDKIDMLAEVLGREHLLGGVTYLNASIGEPGTIVQLGTVQRIVLGELDGSRSKRCETLAGVLKAAGIDAEVSLDVRRVAWQKFIFLTAHGGLTALTRMPIGPVRQHPATRSLLAAAMRETLEIARAEGVSIEEGFIDQQLAFIDRLPFQSTSSMGLDLAKGHRLELEWLSGAVVRRGERHRIPVPVHRAIYGGLVLHAEGRPPSVPS